jgi:hypothetical protein
MNYKKWTIIVLAICAVALIIWDVIVYAKGDQASTISGVIYLNSKEYPIIPFVAGILCGHLFAPLRKLN